MSIGQAKELGGKKFKEQWGPSVLAVLLAAAAIIEFVIQLGTGTADPSILTTSFSSFL